MNDEIFLSMKENPNDHRVIKKLSGLVHHKLLFKGVLNLDDVI